jgi:NADH-quinone oxidoreductase subunit C
MTAADAATTLQTKFASRITDRIAFRGEETVKVESAALRGVLETCRREMGFDYLVDISSLDHFGTEPRFEMVYELYSYRDKTHLRIRSDVPEGEPPRVPSVVDLWPTANWHEREVYDMMGIEFEGHPDLRRILMWEGYPFFPLRKDFPLAGKETEVPDVAFTGVAPLAGGPFVTAPSDASTVDREPRSRES